MAQMKTIYSATTGEIIANVNPSPTAELFIPEGCEAVDGEFSSTDTYIDNGIPTERPITGLPTTHSLPAGEDWVISPVPNGTEGLIDGNIEGKTQSGLTLVFPEPGEWQVDLLPPFPWVGASCEVTVI